MVAGPVLCPRLDHRELLGGASEGPGNIAYVAVPPIVVVPEGRLWHVRPDQLRRKAPSQIGASRKAAVSRSNGRPSTPP